MTKRGAALVMVLLTGCGTSPAAPTGLSSPSVLPSASSSPPQQAPSAASVAPQSCTPPVFSPATTLPASAAPSGGILGMASVAAGQQANRDRVVFTLAGGAATVGWNVSYTSSPSSDGSGNPVAVLGAAFLQVIVTDVGYPGDTGVPDPAVKVLTPTNTTVVQQVVLDTMFEGQYTAFIGLDAVRPVKVFTLSGPPRVVVDVAHC